MLRRPVRTRSLLGVLLAAVLGALLLPASPALAEKVCRPDGVRGPDGTIVTVMVCVEVTPGTPGTPGGGHPEDCGQDEVTPGPGDGPYFCSNGIPCAYTTNVVPLALPDTEPPPGQEWQVMICDHGGFFTKDWVLTGGTQPRPLIVQAMEAYGNLAPPAGEVRHSPDVRGIVGLPTWLWLTPGSFTELRGSSAEGLVAVAVPAETDWVTGDGGSMSCNGPGTPYAPGAGGGCTHTYRAASVRYQGSVTRHWQVRYENGGTVIDIPGAPLTLTADTGWGLQVAEAQVVTGGR